MCLEMCLSNVYACSGLQCQVMKNKLIKLNVKDNVCRQIKLKDEESSVFCFQNHVLTDYTLSKLRR